MESARVVKIDPVSSVVKKISFEIPWDEVKQELENSYTDIAKKAKIKGFRPGKVPRPVLETYYREEAENETIEKIIKRNYLQTLTANSLNPMAPPEIEQDGMQPGNAFIFSATIEVLPEIEPVGYRGLNLQRTRRTVQESDIDKVLNNFRHSFATYHEIADDREIRPGDYVNIDHEAVFEGKRLAPLSGKDNLLPIDGATFHEDIQKELLGMKVGEEKKVTVNFDENHWEKNLAGKEVIFSLKVKGIKAKDLPEINDDFMKNFQDLSSIEELKANIGDSLGREFAAEDTRRLRNDIINELLKANEFEVPPSLVENQMYLNMEDHAYYMISKGIPQDQAIERTKGLMDAYREQAKKTVRLAHVFDNIAKREEIKVSNEDIDARIDKIAADMNESVDNIKKKIREQNEIGKIVQEIVHDKVFSLIEETANITDVDPTGSGVVEK
jgi:trigger factor